ncbi:MAG TPA: exonuclease SbcCD subunit D [Candidatus Tumulicola sp.]|jgi:exonuclease SbcD
MRLLHTSDWHIGVAHHGVDRRADHERVFAQIKALAIEEKVDAILNTGDLFDNPYPNLDTLMFGWSVLEELASLNVPMIVVCGNHDSEKLFQLMSTILKRRLKIYFIDRSTLQERQAGVVHLPTAAGEVLKVAAVPFVKRSSYIREYLEGDPDRASLKYGDAVGSLEKTVGDWLKVDYDAKRDVTVFAAHLLVDGAQVANSEYELYRSRDFVTFPERIPNADYIAFGHIHKPQQIGNLEHARYAGSPIPIDFGEVGDRKLVYLVSGEPGRPMKIEERTLDIGRRLIDIEGTLDDIRAKAEAYAGTIARVKVRVTEPIPQLETQVAELLPDTVICRVSAQFPRPDGAITLDGDTGCSEPSMNELFEQYLQEHPTLGDTERIARYFRELLSDVEHGDDGNERFAGLDEMIP